MRHPISVERQVALTLYYLTSDSDFRTIGHLFGVSKSTVCVVVKAVCSATVLVLLPKHITFPSGENLNAVVQGFK